MLSSQGRIAREIQITDAINSMIQEEKILDASLVVNILIVER